MDKIDDEILLSFVEESQEHLADIENDLLLIEQAGADIDEELVNKVFRAAHSIKGGAGFMGLDTIKELSHKIENVLGMIRSREIVPNSEVINICLLAFDRLRELTADVGSSNEQDISEHVVALNGITSAYLPEEKKEQVNRQVEICMAGGQSVFTVSEFDISHARGENENLYILEYDLIHDVHHEGITPFDLIDRIQKTASIIDCKIDLMAVGTLEEDFSNRIPFLVLVGTLVCEAEAANHFQLKPQRVHPMSGELQVKAVNADSCGVIDPPAGLIAESAVEIEKKEKQVPQPGRDTQADEKQTPVSEDASQARTEEKPGKEKNADVKTPSSSGSGQNNLRVHVSLIDKLMNLAGELVLGRNQLLQAMNENDKKSRTHAAQQINLVTSELQETIMLTRMQPIGNIFNKFHRLIRDLSRELGKKMDLEIFGAEVELDKSMLEGLGDPLTHIMRNAADHGIEDPQTRLKDGKTETGKISLKAFHQAGQIIIEIEDDGRGINPDKVVQSAVKKSLITPDQAEAMSEREKISLIFAPGFSTAEQVTDVSGRGVGMDVVKTNLEKLGGHLEIDSQPGKGTNMRIKLPLTLAIIPGLMVSCSGQKYAIPTVSVAELVRISPGKIHEKIERVGCAQVIRLREELLPLICLEEVLACTSKEGEIAEWKGLDTNNCDRAVHLAVLSSGSYKYGLVVDRLHESEEIVVKPLGRHLKRCDIYAGATILGNGCVSLILDAAGLAKFIHLNELESMDRSIDRILDNEFEAGESKKTLTLFNVGPHQKFAMPVEEVARIEKLDAGDIECIGDQTVIQYRGGVLPVLQVSQFCKADPVQLEGQVLLIVIENRGHNFGILATHPIDTIDTSLVLDENVLHQRGVLGSVIIQGETTRILDIDTITAIAASGDIPGPEKDSQVLTGQKTPDPEKNFSILYVEDSAFFRNQVRELLEEAGCSVFEAVNGREALEWLQENPAQVELILTDIEMPEMDGYEFSRLVKQDARYQHLPIIALTTLAGQQDIKTGIESGIDEYQIKLDKNQLMDAVRKYRNAETYPESQT